MYTRIRVPAELKPTPPQVLEDYVRVRITQFISHFSQRLGHYAPGFAKETLDRAAAEALAYLPPGDHGQLSLEDKQLQLVFRHDCLALGCLDPQCALCTHNPSRRCMVNFDRKYLVNDVLKARCGAGIRVELIDPLTGQPVEEKLPEITLQISVLDGNLYDNKFLDSGKQYEGGTEPAEELDACALLQNKKKSTALLVCGSGGSNDSAGYVLLTMVDGKVPLNDLHVTDSSEAILSGRKPPFRLLVRALLPQNGPRLNIRHAVSEGFVVATRRTRTAGKADIPSVDDPVSKLEHMGKETVKKLADLATAAEQAGVEIDIPENCVQKVGEFKMLALRADQDGHLRQKLQHVLKLSKEKWDEARDHAMRAVVADNRMRAWYADRRSCELGVLFTARMGNVDLDRPVGLLQTRVEAGERKTEAILVAQLNPTQREMLRHMQPQAVAAWWAPGHTGWAIFPMDSDTFLQSGTLTAAAAPPSALATAAATAAATVANVMDAPPSPTQSAVSLSTMPMRRQTGGSGGGDTGGAGQSGDVVALATDSSLMGKPMSLPSGLPLQVLHGGPGQGLNSGGSLPSAFGGSMPSAFGCGMGSGRSSRAGSMTDSPPPSMRMPTPVSMQPPQSLIHHHSLPQPPQSQPQLQPHTSLHNQQQLSQMQTLPSFQNISSLQQHPSLQAHPSLQGHISVQQHPNLQGNASVQPHPTLQQHPSPQGHSLQPHASLQGHPGMQVHPSLQAHSGMQAHPSQRQGGPTGIGTGRGPSFSAMPQSPLAPTGGDGGAPGGSGASPSAPPHMMPPPPPPPAMSASRNMMLPPQPPAPMSFRMPPQHPQQQHQHYRNQSSEQYQHGQQIQQMPQASTMAHMGPQGQHGLHGAGQQRANGGGGSQMPPPPPPTHAQHHPGMQRMQGLDAQSALGRGQMPRPSQQLIEDSDLDGGPPPLPSTNMRMPASGPSFGPQHTQQQRQHSVLSHPLGRGAEDPPEDLQSRGSANPRPHKMPSLGRSLDIHYSTIIVEPPGGMKPDYLTGSGGGGGGGSVCSGGAVNTPPHTTHNEVGSMICKEEAAAETSTGGGMASGQAPSPAPRAPSPSQNIHPGPRALPPVPGQVPQGATLPPPGPPPNPFARVQSGKATTMATGEDTDDDDSDDPLLAPLPSLQLINSSAFHATLGGAGAATGTTLRATGHGGNGPSGGGAAGGGAGAGAGGAFAGPSANGGLNAPLPSLHMIDSQQLDMVLGENMILETSSLNTNLSYGLFLPPAMAVGEGAGLLPGTQSKELLKPTTSGLDTMASMELALPGVRKNEPHALGQQEQKAAGSAGGAVLSHGMGSAAAGVGVGLSANRTLGPYAR
ncbi:hypothetical protein Vafri_2882 [Volvox africanus]|uniref:CSE family protein n=1 Tax=Volvox africanus TaxID=51714 RepID=A0A8J4AQS0_9CHLO|nr:hypothetical protein Vafri_2882 [Volvox africanus]